MALIQEIIAGWPRERMAVLGSRSAASMPPAWPRTPACRAVLLNPAVDPARDLAGYIGEQTAFHDAVAAFLLRARPFIDEQSRATPAARPGGPPRALHSP
jgi:predicted esterase YcpF (UPF0227 family)